MGKEAALRPGLNFVLPSDVEGKEVSVVEVGPFEAEGVDELNRFLGTNITNLQLVKTYLLVHSEGVGGLEGLLEGAPFVDRVARRASLNESLAPQLDFDYDHVLQSMLNPGTSDAEGDTVLRSTMLALGQPVAEDDKGFYSKQFFVEGDLTPDQLEALSEYLANPDLNVREILSRDEYDQGKALEVPLVALEPQEIERFDVASMNDEELLALNKKWKLAATLEELYQFRDQYKDPEFLAERAKVGMDHLATDVELFTWFSLRSEHCFHKEFNARITLEDKINDPIFQRALKKGYFELDAEGNYLLEKGLFKTFIEEPAWAIYDKLEVRGNNWIASMFTDNSGVVYYDPNFMFCIKFETHNSPSNKEPVQGAKTGIDGVNRDIFGTMAGTFEAIANFFHYCTGDPNYQGWLASILKHPYVLLKGITQGVREGGNEMQIPTLGGGLTVDPRYMAKALVHCGTVGWSPVMSPEGVSYIGRVPKVGDVVMVAGQPVGVDGVGGATQSSEGMSKNIDLGHVQADFSYVQTKMQYWHLECARALLFNDTTDFGAVGLASASHEMARSTGGLFLDLAKHPLKYSGIRPVHINASETQDRMLEIVAPGNRDEVMRRAALHDVQVTELGNLTDTGFIHLTNGDQTVAYMDIERLFNKEPRKEMHATWNVEKMPEPEVKTGRSLEDSLCLVMSQPDVASKEWFFRQKDSSVKGGTIQGPLIGLDQDVEADATIQKPLDTEGRDHGALAYASGFASKVSDIDPYYAVQRSLVDMACKIIAIGGALPDMENPKWDAWGICGNYCQPNSESRTTLTKETGEHNLASLIREGIAARETTEALNLPIISGKDSMKCTGTFEVSDSFSLDDVPADLRRYITVAEKLKKVTNSETGDEEEIMQKCVEIHDPDSYLASCAVKIEDWRKCVNSAFKREGDLVYVIGTTKKHLGASQYYSAIGYAENGAPLEGGDAPQADLEEFASVGDAVHSAVDKRLVASCSAIHEGGLFAALAKASMAGKKGVDVDTAAIIHDGSCDTDEDLLYSQTPGRLVVTVASEDKDKFEQVMADVPCSYIGKVSADNEIFVEKLSGESEAVSINKVKASYQKQLRFDLDKAM